MFQLFGYFQKPVPSIVMPKKPRRSVQNRRPMLVQRTLLPKSQVNCLIFSRVDLHKSEYKDQTDLRCYRCYCYVDVLKFNIQFNNNCF